MIEADQVATSIGCRRGISGGQCQVGAESPLELGENSARKHAFQDR